MADIRQALCRIAQGELEQGFAELADAYAEGQNNPAILHDLKKGFWKPNLDEMERIFRKNVAILEKYPFLLTKKFVAPTENDRLLFPLTDDLFYCLDQQQQVISPLIIGSERETQYFFKDLDRPLFVESEYNLYNLRFLRDNVRRSEDFAGDNHIYLHYENANAFSILLYYSDMEELCRDEKFVFLIGDEKEIYPLDFKTQFEIDYGKMEPRKLRMEEMQRICFWYKRGYCGMMLGLDALDHNPNVVAWYAADLYYYSYIKGYPFHTTNLPEEILKNTTQIYTLQGLKALSNSPEIQWGITDMTGFIQWLDSEQITSFTLPELFRVYFIYKFYQKKGCINPRIVPVILWEPHINTIDIHNPLVLDFPYITVLNSFRDPVKTVGRIYQREGSIFITQILAIGYSMHPRLRKHYYSYRFEDLKLYPEETCKALCKLLNVPYDPDMLNADGAEEIQGEPCARGFDQAPLHRNIDSAFSPFDQVRLQIFYDSVLRHYGYPAFDFDECPMDDNDAAFLFKFPFRCEKDYVEKGRWEKITHEQLRQNLFQNMIGIWKMGKQGELVFPKVIYPKLDDNAAILPKEH